MDSIRTDELSKWHDFATTNVNRDTTIDELDNLLEAATVEIGQVDLGGAGYHSRAYLLEDEVVLSFELTADGFIYAYSAYQKPATWEVGALNELQGGFLPQESELILLDEGQVSSTAQRRQRTQPTVFVGAPGTTANRQLDAYAGPLPPIGNPGGTVIPNTAGTHQNCAGNSIGIQEYINWPHLGYEAANGGSPHPAINANWNAAKAFVPNGCTRVDPTGVDIHHTRCPHKGLELILFLYRWPVTLTLPGGQQIAAFQSDFHMIGRTIDGMPFPWHSKMDRREEVKDIYSPEGSLSDAYPHTNQGNREIVKLVYCCDPSKIQTK